LKDEDSEHVLKLEPWMKPFFQREFAERKREKLAFGEGYNDRGLVFASYNGNPVKERTLEEHFNKIVAAAELPEIRFHDLRHTCITIMLKRGWSLKHAQNRAHHASVETTGDTYSHITRDMQQDVNQDMTKALKVNTGEALEFRPMDKIQNARRTKKPG
jgi:integrase